jgi:tetratricopeptide (TPR) repeat protein
VRVIAPNQRLDELAASLADRYQIDRTLGTGGMANVYLARDLRHQRSVALKVLHPDLSSVLGPERFRREIEIAARLQHPHILTVFDSGETDGLLWFTMPYIEGESLRDLLDREHELPVDHALRIAAEVADALEYAHAQGVIHRDIKPENILLSAGHALVADFGIARALSDESDRLTSTGLAIGTPAYMSPEQGSGDRQVEARSDVYSLASVTYEMLTGEAPYSGGSARAVMTKRMTDPVPSARRLRTSISPALDQAISRGMAPTPADRFATAGEFARALSAAPLSRAGSIVRRPRIVGAVALGLAVAAIGLIWSWSSGTNGAGPPSAAAQHVERGNALLARRTPEAAGEAVAEFEAALALDSTDATAQANIGYAFTMFLDWGWPFRDMSPAELRARAIQHSERAITLDSLSAPVWLARAYVLSVDDPYRLRGAVDAYSRALALDSTNAEGWYQFGQTLMVLGRFDEAARAYRQAFTLDPNRPMAYMSLSSLSMREGRVAEARGLIDSAVTASRTVTSPYVRVVRGLVALAAGDVRLARDEAELALVMDSVYTIPARTLLVKVLAAEGNRADATRELERILPQDDTADVAPTAARFLASALVTLDRVPEALTLLERARPRGAYLWYYLQTTEFDPIRDEPRFQQIYHEADPSGPGG